MTENAARLPKDSWSAQIDALQYESVYRQSIETPKQL